MGGQNKVSRLPKYLAAILAVWALAGVLIGVADATGAAGDWRNDENGRIQVDVHYDCGRPAPVKALAHLGFAVSSSVKLASWCVVEGWLPPESLGAAASIAGVTGIRVPTYTMQPRHRLPDSVLHDLTGPLQSSSDTLTRPAAAPSRAIDQNGATIMRADQFVTQTGTSGGGIKVGVQSVGITSLQLIRSRGELPAVQVVQPSDGASSPTGDEGTALLEEVHAVAPGADLAYCGPSTLVEYTSCLTQLIAAGATVLVDDLLFPQSDLLSANSDAAVAIEGLLKDHPTVVIFTAAGNYNGSYWEGNYTPVALSSLGLPPLTCSSGATPQTDYYVAQFEGDPSELLTVMQSSRIPVVFTWADPPGHNASKFDIYWVNNSTNTQAGCIATGGLTDTRVLQGIPFSAGTYKLYIATPDTASSGTFLKLWVGGDGLTSLSKSTTGSTVAPQSFASGVVTIGAVNGSDGLGRDIETFSSLGPITLAFPQLTHLQSPLFVAPDGVNIDASGTYFEGSLFPDGNFYGTSASVPNAGGVAALLRGAFPFLTAAQLVTALKAGAVQLGTTVPDGTFGYGRIDALGALGTFPVPTMTPLPDSSLAAGASSPEYAFTVTGMGPLHFTVTSSNTSLIPSTVVAAGSPGVTITPADCGTNTLTCSLSVTSANGVSDTVTVTVAALDGANRSATATMKVQVAGSPAPPASSKPGSGGGGGAFEWWTVIMLLAAYFVSVRFFDESAPSAITRDATSCVTRTKASTRFLSTSK